MAANALLGCHDESGILGELVAVLLVGIWGVGDGVKGLEEFEVGGVDGDVGGFGCVGHVQ